MLKSSTMKTQADYHPQFVQLQTLTKGDVFVSTRQSTVQSPSACIYMHIYIYDFGKL